MIALSLPRADGELLRACEDLGLLAGYLIAAHARCTDLYNLYRRRKSMSLAASMQWDLLPPLVLRAGSVCVAGHVEPAYDVGGDGFDYAANGPVFDFAIMDAMGHGLSSAAVAGLAMGAYRHARREARSLVAIHAALDEIIATRHEDTFVTGQLGRIETHTGALTWTNAGHPLPLLIRAGHVVGELECEPTVPWGVSQTGAVPLATASLEPGDCVLLYTDGVTEARTPGGKEFGVDHLMDIFQGTASHLLEPQEVIRLLVRRVLEHQQAPLADDATLVLVRWDGPPTG